MEAHQRLRAERAWSCLMALLPVIGHAVLMRPWLARLPLPALGAIAPTIPHLPPSSAAMVGAMPASDANSVLTLIGNATATRRRIHALTTLLMTSTAWLRAWAHTLDANDPLRTITFRAAVTPIKASENRSQRQGQLNRHKLGKAIPGSMRALPAGRTQEEVWPWKTEPHQLAPMHRLFGRVTWAARAEPI